MEEGKKEISDSDHPVRSLEDSLPVPKPETSHRIRTGPSGRDGRRPWYSYKERELLERQNSAITGTTVLRI